MRNIHKIDVILGTKNQPKNTTGDIQKYFKHAISDNTIDALMARLTVIDGISFSTICRSIDLQELIKLKYNSCPKSPTTVKTYVENFANEVKKLHIDEIKNDFKSVPFMSLGFDEWTSICNKKYLNLIVFGKNKFWNLGLIRIEGSANSTVILEHIKNRLNSLIDRSSITNHDQNRQSANEKDQTVNNDEQLSEVSMNGSSSPSMTTSLLQNKTQNILTSRTKSND
ncbi:hypothetical protein BLOT_002308 [Blomia tropicalis]|nr:hypothetical protein BLOT_002308 [Blomia tropicalis]